MAVTTPIIAAMVVRLEPEGSLEEGEGVDIGMGAAPLSVVVAGTMVFNGIALHA